MLRILIADRHPVLRRGVRSLIERHVGWEVCAEAEDGCDALEMARIEKPDIAILGVALPTLNGIALALRLRQETPKTSVLMFTMCEDHETISGALAAGARGFVLKNDNAEHLEAAISAIGANRPYFSTYVSDLMLNAVLNDCRLGPKQGLTSRELEIALMIAEGQPNKAIGTTLGISPKTVETHRGAAMRKAGVRTAAALVRFVMKHHLIAA